MYATDRECAAMAAAMLDAELLTVMRRLQGDSLTDFQRAVLVEASKRKLKAQTGTVTDPASKQA